jgi:SAM-dependent methyltransferase
MAHQTSHLDQVRDDQSYSEILAGWDGSFYDKFTARLRPDAPGARVLDVGCGVGQVVVRLAAEGYDAHGVDVAEANIVKARLTTDRCQWYDGGKLPFADGSFAAVGALNVLEHVEEPEAFLAELVRVTAPGGKIVVSSPNFLRAIGWRDYHPRMFGIGNKLKNARALLQRRRQMQEAPETVRFERMKPIIKTPFTPDDDAIVCTNALDMAFFLRRLGCEVVEVACTDRIVSPLVDWVLNATPLRYAMFNAFVLARRK